MEQKEDQYTRDQREGPVNAEADKPESNPGRGRAIILCQSLPRTQSRLAQSIMLRSVRSGYRASGPSRDLLRTVEITSHASGSRHLSFQLSPLRYDPQMYRATWSSLRKGKQREGTPIFAARGIHLLARDPSWRAQIRSFHSTRPRYAVPLIPAAAAVLKSASLLTIVTHVARILISFFPIGTIAALRFRKGAKWLAGIDPPPQTTPEAEEFFLMWCRDQKPARLSSEDATQLLRAEHTDDDALSLPDGRVAYCTLGMPNRYKAVDPDNERRRLRFIRAAYFFMPPLPPASQRFYDEFSDRERADITALRRHWISTQMFKERLGMARWVIAVIFGLPILLLLGVWISALERTPLTGRWRLILLTPEEEDHISKALAGPNWYKSVINLLTTPENPAPPVLPLTDWRWEWVTSTLRQLEAVVVQEAERTQQIPRPGTFTGADKPSDRPSAVIAPPPTGYPIKPRPRMSSMLHSHLPGGDKASGQEHLELGPPYSLLLLDKKDRNAFSYGFGGKGAGGIVVYTGLLNDILREGIPNSRADRPRGLWSSIFGSTAPTRPQPTEAQTLHLASVLAHEMGHLLLSHHLETLSQQQVLWPSILGLSVDLTRAFIWPLTFFLGPTVNDALANVGRTSVTEMADRYGQIGFQWKHEYEADFAGIRLLALAGYDPREAVAHFSDSVADLHEIQPMDSVASDTVTSRLFKLWTESTHPSAEQRVAAIRRELEKWTFA